MAPARWKGEGAHIRVHLGGARVGRSPAPRVPLRAVDWAAVAAALRSLPPPGGRGSGWLNGGGVGVGAARSGRGRGAGMTELRQRLGREPGGTREPEEKVGMRAGERRGRGRGAGPAAGGLAARPADGGGSGGGGDDGDGTHGRDPPPPLSLAGAAAATPVLPRSVRLCPCSRSAGGARRLVDLPPPAPG